MTSSVKTPRLFPPRVLLASTAEKAGNSIRTGASSIYRFASPANALRRSGRVTALINYGLPDAKSLSMAAPDTVVMQSHYTDQLSEAVRIYKKQKAFLAYDLDDLVWDLDDSNPNKGKFPADMLARLRKVCSSVDTAIVSTPRLAEHVKKSLGFSDDRIRIVRNCLPQAFIDMAIENRPKNQAHSKPRVGWAGGNSHAGDIAILKEVVERTHNDIQWVFMDSMPDVPHEMVEFHPGVAFAQYPAKLASLDLDLALAPLADTEFNSCKSDLRIMEYAACGYPILASNSPAFADVPQGIHFTKDNSPEEWVNNILDCLSDIEALSVNAQQLHDWLKNNRTLESIDNLKRWAWAWTPDNQIPFEPGNASFEETAPVIVGEPITSLPFPPCKTIAEAHANHPYSPIIYVRPGCVPTDEQLGEIINEGPKHISTCALSNDSDYPAPGQFVQLAGRVMQDMSEAALSLIDAKPIQVPYAVGPLTYLSAKAIAVAGIPDESRFDGDIELAAIDWCARLRDMGISQHAVMPNLFVPVHMPSRFVTEPEFGQNAIRNIAVWHPSFQSCNQETSAAEPQFGAARRLIDRNYARISYEAPNCADYQEWSALHDTIGNTAWADLLLISPEKLPTISIVLPVYNTAADTLTAAINSVKEQTYPHWQLVIVDDNSSTDGPETVFAKLYEENDQRIQIYRRAENGHISAASNTGVEHCSGDWVYFLDHDDMLAPYALTVLAAEIINNPNANLIYGDSDMISPEGKLHSPDFKPGFDYDLLLGQNYIRGCYKTEVIRTICKFRTEFNGSQDYDLTLRYIELECWKKDFGPDINKIAHITFVLYHWRQSPDSVSSDINNKPYAIEAARKAVLGHLKRIGKNAFIGPHPQAPLHNLVRFLPDNPAPKVSIIVLTQLDRRRLDTCLKSILEKTSYPNYEVIVRQVGDDSGVAETIRLIAKKDNRVKHAHGGGHAGTFNFALLNNTVVDKHIASDSEVLLFLNDDTQIVENAWLADMVGTVMRSDVGAVGVKLMYPNGQIQHNGITLDYAAPRGEYALHLHRGAMHNDPGLFGRSVISRQTIAVTAACMAIRREVFLSVKGFDAVKFPLDYNDVDLCLRLMNAGYVNVVLSHITVVHHEGGTKRANGIQVSRAAMLAAEETIRVMYESVNDPYTNPNLEHHPSNTMVKTAPERPWTPNTRQRVLLIGADRSDAHVLYVAGELPFRAEADGPWLRLVEPIAQHGGLVDMRDKLALAALIGDLDINRIILRNAGKASVDVLLGTLIDIGRVGMPIEYVPSSFEAVCPRLDCTNSEGACGHKWQNPTTDACQLCIDRDGSPYGSVSVTSWRVAWARFNTMLIEQKANNENTEEPLIEAAE